MLTLHLFLKRNRGEQSSNDKEDVFRSPGSFTPLPAAEPVSLELVLIDPHLPLCDSTLLSESHVPLVG